MCASALPNPAAKKTDCHFEQPTPFARRGIEWEDHAYRFLRECIWKFGSKNVAFLTSRMFASSMIRVFPSLEHSAGHVRIPEDNGRTFWCVGHAPSDCPNMEETRNSMQTFNRKKCSHFSPTNIPSAFPSEIGRMYFLSYSFARQKGIVCSKRQSLFLPLYAKTRASHPHLPQIFCFILR